MKPLLMTISIMLVLTTLFGNIMSNDIVSHDISRKAADYLVKTTYSQYNVTLFDSFSYFDLDEERIADIYVYAKNDKWNNNKEELLLHLYETSIKLEQLMNGSFVSTKDDGLSEPSDSINSYQNTIKSYNSILNGAEDFITIYISATQSKMPIWEYREGLPESYYVYDIEKFYRNRNSDMPDIIKFYYNGPMQVFLKDYRTNSIINFEDNEIEADLNKIGDFIFRSQGLPEDDLERNQLAWDRLVSNTLEDLLSHFNPDTRSVHTISNVPYFHQENWNASSTYGHTLFPASGSCAVMAAASALFYYDSTYENLVPFGTKVGNYTYPEAGFSNTPGISILNYPHPHPSGETSISYGTEEALIRLAEKLHYNFEDGGTPVDWTNYNSDYADYTNNYRSLNFTYETKRKTITTSPHTYAEIKQQMDLNRPMLITINKFSWDSSNNTWPVSGMHDVCIMSYDDNFSGWGQCIGVFTNGRYADNPPYSTVYWNYSNLVSTQNILYTQPWTLKITPGGNFGSWINPPNATYPTNNSTITPGTFNFTWQSVSSYGYWFQLSSNSNFSSYIVNNSNVSNPYLSVTLNSTGTYYWRVAPKNSNGNWTNFNNPAYSCTISLIPPNALSATNITQSAFDARWEVIPRVVGYRLDVSTSSNFSTFLTGYNNRDVGIYNQISITGLSYNTYYYRSRAVYSVGTSTNSNVISVTLLPPDPDPSLVVNPTSIDYGNVLVNSYSDPQTYSMTGSYLTANVTITAPTRYQVSLSSSSGYSSSLSITPSGGSVSRTIYVRFNPNASGTVTGNVTNASSGATTRNVSVSGNGINPTPDVDVSPNSLSFGNQIINTSATQSYELTGSYLTANVTVTAPSGYTVSTSQSGTYTSTLTVTPIGGDVDQTIWVKFTPTQAISYSGNVSNASSGASTANVAVSGTGFIQGPLINVVPNSLSFGNQIINTSATQSYLLTGSYLTANVTVTAPSGFTVSTSQSGTYSSTLAVTQSGGNVNQTVWVKFSPTQTVAYGGNVSNASSGASTVYVAVTGTGINPGPYINVNPGSLNFGNLLIDTSTTQSYQLTANSLTTDVTVSTPSGYTVSTSQGGTYSSTLTVTQSGGSVNQVVWVKFTPTQTITYTGGVTNASNGASTVSVTVTGTGVENTNLPYLDLGQFNTYLPAGQTLPGRYNFPSGIPNNKAFNILYSQSGPYPTSVLKYHVIDSGLVSSTPQTVFAEAPDNMSSPAIFSNTSSVYIAGLYNSGGRDPLHFNKYNIASESMTSVSSNSSWPTDAFSDIVPLDILKSSNGSIYVIHSWRYVSWSIPEDDLYMRYSNDEMLTWGPWVQGEHTDGVGVIYDAMMVEGTDNSIHIALWVDWGGAHKSVYFKYSTITNSFVQRSVIGTGKNACLFIDNATGNICMTYLDVQGQLVARTSNVSDTSIWSTEQIVLQQIGGTWGTSNSVSNSQYDQERFWYQWTSPTSRHIIEWDGTSNWYDHGDITSTMPSNIFDSSKIYRLQNGDLHIVQGYKDSLTDIYYTHLERIISSQIPDPFGIPGSLYPPQNMSISCNSTTININWNAVPNATSYKVYSSTNPSEFFTEDLSGTFAGCSWACPIGESYKFYYVTALAASTAYQACDFPPILLGEWYDDPNNVWNISIRNIPPYRIRTGNIYYWPQTTHFNGNRYRVLAFRDGTSEEHTFFFENVTTTTMDANHTLGNVWEPIGGFTGHHKN